MKRSSASRPSSSSTSPRHRPRPSAPRLSARAAEEAQRKAEEAALAAAKYAAAYELAQLQQNGEGLTGHAKEAYDKALADAAAAIEAAKTPAEVDAALAAAREALNNALCPSAAFTDVEENVWYHDGIDFMVRNGYMNGVAADTFDVTGSLTRAQLVTVLYRIAGEPETSAAIPFADVADGSGTRRPLSGPPRTASSMA